MTTDKAENKYEKACEEYRLIKADEGNTPSDRKWWRREGIYLSDVCLVVHVSPTIESLEDADELNLAKDALYAYLRRISQRTLEHDFMRPLACVISNGQCMPSERLVKRLRSWGSDQEWHRGSFTFYVEILLTGESSDSKTSHWYRLQDLLSPKIEPIVETVQKPTRQDVIIKIDEQLVATNLPDPELANKLRNAIDETLQLYEAASKPEQAELPIMQWKSDVFKAAHNVKPGEQQS
jgi:hypothetical protein